jgi:hypothetical protein
MGVSGYGCSFVDSSRGIVWATVDSDVAKHGRIDLNVTAGSRTLTQDNTFYSAGWNNTARYIESKDMLIAMWCDFGTTAVKIKRYSLATGTPVELSTLTQSAIKNVSSPGFGFDWCPDTGKFYLYEGRGSTTLHVLTPPSDWTSSATWTWSTETMGGETPAAMTEIYGVGGGGDGVYSKWIYHTTLKCFMWSQGKVQRMSPDGVTRDGAFQLYRPIGT